MDLAFTPAQQAFRHEVRNFVEQHLPADIRSRVMAGEPLGKEHSVRWQHVLHSRGWGAPSWPKAFGGPGWSAVEQHLFEEECALAGAPMQIPFGLRMVAPVLMAFGTPAQQQRYLPGIVSGEDWWCQGYSEPGAGSDLAALKTRAERSDNGYIVNGQKTWTSHAQHADWMFCLARTSSEGRPQHGISFLLIDMKAPGVTLRPIRLLDGQHEVNEVWLENVAVPLAQRIGDENRGWACAKYLLGHERTLLVQLGACKRELQRLKTLARAQRSAAGSLLADTRFRDRIAQVDIDLMALEVSLLRTLADEDRQRAPGAESSLLKLRATELQQALSELLMRAAGPQRTTLVGQYFNMRKTTIFGGSTEIQKNIVAQQILGL